MVKRFHNFNIVSLFVYALISISQTRTPEFVNVELYSRGLEQEKINDVPVSFIKVNGTDRIVLNEHENYRGMNVVLTDEFTGLVNKSIGFDVHLSGDDAMAAFLKTIKTNRIVAIVGFDEPSVDYSILEILRSWGCSYSAVSSVGYRDAFIFIGSKNSVNISNWTYCEQSYRASSAILKSFEIPLKQHIPFYFPYEMMKIAGSYICDTLTDSLDIVYHIDYQTCAQQCLYKYDETECVMINYVLNGKILSDSRCYIFDSVCNFSSDNGYGNIISFKGLSDTCMDYPVDWIDIYGDTCFYYSEYNWCNKSSSSINNISIESFIIHSDHVYELNAIQSCCDCGGGLQIYDDKKLEFSIGLSNDNLLCNWNLPTQIYAQWTSINLFDLCSKMNKNVVNNFNAMSHNNMNLFDCSKFITSSFVSGKDDIILCNSDGYFSKINESYFTAMFDVDMNGTSKVYLNSHWFDTTQIQYLVSETKTYLQCMTDLTVSNASIYGIFPCDIITESPTYNPITEMPTYDPTQIPTKLPTNNPTYTASPTVFFVANNAKNHQSAIDTLIAMVVVLFFFLIILVYIVYKLSHKVQNENHGNVDRTGTSIAKMKKIEMEMKSLRSTINEVKNERVAPPAYMPSTDNHRCLLCVDKTANMFNYPCGHVSYCEFCSISALDNDNKCPNCREIIQECKNIYSGGFKPESTDQLFVQY